MGFRGKYCLPIDINIPMNRPVLIFWCLAYWAGLLLSRWGSHLVIGSLLLPIALLLSLLIRRFSPRDWLIGGIITLFALLYFQFRFPHPHSQDISQLLNPKFPYLPALVTGKVLSEVRETSNNRQQFWFAAQSATISTQPEQVRGKLYVTLPNSSEKLYPSQVLTLEGTLYQPRKPVNPGEFDFKTYLALQSTFAGFKAEKILRQQPPTWGMWQLRQRIVKAQKQGLGAENGSLLSSIVLGRQAVSLDPQIKNDYLKVGLAHILAASGFQVALLLGVTLHLSRLSAPKTRFLLGVIILVFYLGLTGLQPSIFRAVLMGIGVLIGSVLERKVNPSGSLLLAGTILLIIDPVWIWNLGFQLSFLATLGLIVTAPILDSYLDWLPAKIIPFVSIPLAAFVWTFPLLLHSFSVISNYSIVVNIITAPLITLISLGGMLSAGLSLIYPPLGSLLASFLALPMHILTTVVGFFAQLPGTQYTVGKLPLVIMIILYGGMVFIWLNKNWGQKYWKILALIMIALITIPVIYFRSNLAQVTVLSLTPKPAIVVQCQGDTLLVNGEDDGEDFKYRVLPFLTQQGINRLDGAVSSAKGSQVPFPVKKVINPLKNELSQNLNIGKITLDILSHEPVVIQFHINQKTWLWIEQGQENIPPDLVKSNLVPNPEVLLWSGEELNLEWLDLVNPNMAIAATKFISQPLRQQLRQKKIRWYWIKRDGSLQWQEKTGLKKTITEDID